MNPCARCGQPTRSRKNRYCSRDCYAAARTERPLPFAPVLARAGTLASADAHNPISGARALAERIGWNVRRVQRARAGLTVYDADEIACRLGCHPSEIWGDEWLAALDVRYGEHGTVA